QALRKVAGGNYAGDYADGFLKPTIGQDYSPTGAWEGLLGEQVSATGNVALAKRLIKESGAKFPNPLVFDYQKSPLGDKTLFMLIKKHLDKITNIHGQEESLWSDTLRLAGRFDCIADYDGEISIIDFKSSRKEKRKSDIQNYFQQACAYAHMWLERTGQKKLPQTVILVACDSGVDQEFIEDSKNAREGLKKSIELYWSKNNFEELQEQIKNELAKETSIVG
ncbi:MAG: hypothetical protein EBU08_14030, partial [Micrococcales bacterium]|nr:hypothetical protein [Micrococcales bacterium]